MSVRFRTTGCFCAAVAGAWLLTTSLAAQTPARTAPLDQAIPMDPSITTGTLPNGLRYYVRANTEPADRAELRLVVNVGSIVEAEDQRGLAHFVEHMAFNGTRNFPKQALVEFMESIGMRFGPSVNAYTSFDETVYMLQVPTDRPDVLDTALNILQDWAQAVTMDGAEIDKERGVVIEEWRLRRGAGARMLDAQFPILLAGSTYADRLPIGTTDVLENFPHERLRQFYRDWYRPDLMAVIAVGDFDAAAVTDAIRTRFAAVPAATSPLPRPVLPVPDQPGTSFAIATDPEATSSTVTVLRKSDVRDQSTFAAYRRSLVEQMFAGMLSARLADLAQKPETPFIAAGAGRGSFVRTKEASMLNGLAKEGQIAETLTVLMREAERVAQHGFVATELERQKTAVMRGYERQVTERRNQPSAVLAAEYARNYLEGEPVPGIELEFELAGRFLPEITIDEVNQLARTWVPDGNRVIQISAPQKAGVPVPDEATLTAVLAAAAAAPVDAYVDRAADEPLLESEPVPGKVTAETPANAFGITEWRLSNGVRVVLLPTTHKDDEVVVRGFSPGGSSLVADEDFVAADSATVVLGAGGLGSFSAVDLRRKLTGKVASANVSIVELEELVSGSASKKDLETLFQLIHLRFTQPRADAEAFGVLQNQLRTLLSNQEATPGYAFSTVLQSVLTNDHVRARPLSTARLDEMNLDRSLEIYRDRFGDAGDFTIIVVGSFDLPAIRPLVERYIASLPSGGRTEQWRDVGMTRPEGIVERRVEKGLEPQSRAVLVYSGALEPARASRDALRAMTSILQTRLRETLREDLGGTYSVGVSSSASRWPKPEYQVSISFGSAPERNDALVARTFEEIARFQTEGPTPSEVNDAIEALVRSYETSREQNPAIAAALHAAYRDGSPLDDVFNATPGYRAITGEAIQAAARRYLTADRYVKVQLFPEKR